MECTLPLHNQKARILNPGITSCGLFDTVITPPRQEALVIFLCDDMIIRIECITKILAVGNGYGYDSNHPHMPLMPTGKDPGKPLSWVDLSLSMVETVMTGKAGGDMMSAGCV